MLPHHQPVRTMSTSCPHTMTLPSPPSLKTLATETTEEFGSFEHELLILLALLSSHSVRLFATPWTAAHQAFLPFTISQSLLKLMSIGQWCHPTISSSVGPFSCLQFFPASKSFLMSQFFASGGQNIGASASASVLPMNIQDCFPLGLTGWISLQSKGLSRVFSTTTVQKHQFFSAQLSLWSNTRIHTWLLEKP